MLLVYIARGVYHAIGPQQGYIGIIAESRPGMGEYAVLSRECGCNEEPHEEVCSDRAQAAVLAKWYDDHPYDGLGWVQIDHAETVGIGDDECVRYRTEVIERGSGVRCNILFQKLKRKGIGPGSIIRLYNRCGKQLECWFQDFDETLTTGGYNGNLEASER